MAKKRRKTSKKRRAKTAKAGWGSPRKYNKRAFKGQVPLEILEKRQHRLTRIVRQRGGTTL